MVIDTGSGSRKATLTRIAITALVVLPVGFVGLLYAGTGVGLPFAVPAAYMLWVLATDTFALVRSARDGEVYHARPAYKWFVVAGILVVAMWIGYRIRAHYRPKNAIIEAQLSS